MIEKVDGKLTSLLEGFVAGITPLADVILEAPTKEVVGGKPTNPIVSAYLYDVREELSRRATGRMLEEQVTHLPPRYLRLSYMITTWASQPQNAHQLLSLVYIGLAKVQSLELDVSNKHNGEAATESLTLTATVELEVGRAPMEDRILSELWSTFESPLAPLLNLAVTVPMVTFDLEPPTKHPDKVSINLLHGPKPPSPSGSIHTDDPSGVVLLSKGSPRRRGREWPVRIAYPGTFDKDSDFGDIKVTAGEHHGEITAYFRRQDESIMLHGPGDWKLHVRYAYNAIKGTREIRGTYFAPGSTRGVERIFQIGQVVDFSRAYNS
ncbi:Pvc16 family protein [Streptomyces murinus]|uniref:Pvc16 family protein n=1 Tax=Streptomyces murinus TaxID=33900 RepID=UPI003821806D